MEVPQSIGMRTSCRVSDGCWRPFRRAADRYLAAALLALSTSSEALVYRATPENYGPMVSALRPGDMLMLSPGEYRDGLAVHDLVGKPQRPIMITGPERGAPAVFVAREHHNTVSIVDSAYVVIRNLALEGHGLPVDAVKAEGHSHWAHHVTLEHLVIRGHGNNQQTVGISTKCPAWNWVLRGNAIFGAGTGMYLGNSDGNAPFVAGLIERNVIVDTIGYNLQIKHQNPRPDLGGIPRGRSTTIIRHNVFAKTKGDSVDEARPNVLVGHLPLSGPGVEDDYVIYGNFFYQNPHEALFQGEGNVALYSNLFYNEYRDAIRIQPHNDIPRRITVAYNTVLAGGIGISLIRNEGVQSFRQVVAANAVFSDLGIAGGTQIGNVTAPLAEARTFLRRPFASLGVLDLSPQKDWPAAAANKQIPVESFPDWTKDFDGRTRSPGSIGAYNGRESRSRWLPQLEPKP